VETAGDFDVEGHAATLAVSPRRGELE
jgi:hypothetical protein